MFECVCVCVCVCVCMRVCCPTKYYHLQCVNDCILQAIVTTSSEKKSSMSIAILLASNGADLDARNKKNQTPLDLCPDPNLLKLLTKCHHDYLVSQKRASLPVSIETSSNGQTDGRKSCVMCSERPRDVLLGPCGHVVTCSGCAGRLKRCLLCKEEVVSTTKVHAL